MNKRIKIIKYIVDNFMTVDALSKENFCFLSDWTNYHL